MGQALSIGFLADLVEHDEEGAERWRRWFEAINRLLTRHGLPEHIEPEVIRRPRLRQHLASFPYGWTWHLRRAMAYVATGTPLHPCAPGEAASDPVLEEELYMFSSHLISLTDTIGVYVPIDFPAPLPSDHDDPIPGGMLGSSHQLLRELVVLGPALGVELTDTTDVTAAAAEALIQERERSHPFWIERKAWWTYFELARASTAHRTALVMH